MSDTAQLVKSDGLNERAQKLSSNKLVRLIALTNIDRAQDILAAGYGASSRVEPFLIEKLGRFRDPVIAFVESEIITVRRVGIITRYALEWDDHGRCFVIRDAPN